VGNICLHIKGIPFFHTADVGIVDQVIIQFPFQKKEEFFRIMYHEIPFFCGGGVFNDKRIHLSADLPVGKGKIFYPVPQIVITEKLLPVGKIALCKS
jgi:hypothetical protein